MEAGAASIESLNAAFGRPGSLSFVSGPGGLAAARLSACGATALLALHGATLLSYEPEGLGETFFLSPKSAFKAGSPIRGGIPLCFPWFGDLPGRADLPKHGFFRLFAWDVEESSAEGGAVSISLRLSSSEATKAFWPGDFSARYRLRLGDTLSVSVELKNRGAEEFSFSCAFHPYFRVSNVREIAIPGLEGEAYQDRAAAPGAGTASGPGPAGSFRQEGPLSFSGEVDRAYLRGGAVEFADRAEGRLVRVEGRKLPHTVVWNPGKAKGDAIPDLEEGAYLRYLCVEPALVPPPGARLGPGQSFEAGIEIGVSRLA